MNNYGFIRTAAAVPAIRLADTKANTAEICRLIKEAAAKEVSLVVFPELCITGATCGDLYTSEKLLKGAEESIIEIARLSLDLDICIVVGAPAREKGVIYNCTMVIQGGMVQGCVRKPLGKRCTSASEQLFAIGDVVFGIEFADDLLSATPSSSV